MCSSRDKKQSIDDLIAESRRIQDALIRVVVKLDVFADQLSAEAAKLQEVTDGRVPDSEAASHDADDQASGSEDGGTTAVGGGGS